MTSTTALPFVTPETQAQCGYEICSVSDKGRFELRRLQVTAFEHYTLRTSLISHFILQERKGPINI